MQSRGTGVRRNKKAQFPESTKSIKGYDLVLGSLLFLNKSAPSPRFRFNLYLQYNVNNGKLLIPEDIKKTVEELDTLLTGRIENSKIEILEEEDVEL